MSGYLNHLAALTLNQLEPVQPRLVSRFEAPIAGDHSNDHQGLAQEFQMMQPESRQPATADDFVQQKIVTAPVEGQATKNSKQQAESGQVMARGAEQSEPLSQQQKFAGWSDSNAALAQTRSDQSLAKANVRSSYELGHPPMPTEKVHSFVEHVQEHFSDSIASERVISDAPINSEANQIAGKNDEKLRAEPVKPASIMVQSHQDAAKPNTSSEAVVKSLTSAQADANETPAPTINVTIGRIEIRATQTTEKPLAKPRAAGTTMSLDDYLKQRNGGRA